MTGHPMRNILLYYSSQQVHTGSPRVLMRLVEGLDQSCFKPYFLAENEGDLSLELKKRGAKLIRGKSGQITKKTIHRNLGNILTLIYLLRKHRISLVHINELGWNSELAVAAWLCRIPVFFHIHNPEKLSRQNLNCCVGSQYLFVSKDLAQRCGAPHLLGEKSRILYNPITVERFTKGRSIRHELGIPDNVPVIGTVAQICRRKGIDIVIETARNVLKSLPQIRFVVVGPDAVGEESFASQMRSRVRELEFGDRFIFCGARNDIENVLASIDLFFLPARSEPFGMVIAEAMAARVPVVASNVGGIPEIIPNEDFGITAALEKGSFDQHIIQLLRSPERRFSISEKGYVRVKSQFSDAIFNHNLSQIYLSELNH